MHIPHDCISQINDPWIRLAWAVLFRAVADLYVRGRRSSATCYLRSRRAGVLMDQLGVDQGRLLACHDLVNGQIDEEAR